jgi:gliding motility-associated-like protein
LDSNWLYPDSIYARWGDTLEIITGFKDTIYKLKYLEHTYKTGGKYLITVDLIPYRGCPGSGNTEVRFSHEVHFRSKIRCPDQESCFLDSVLELGVKPVDWRWKDNALYGQLYWDFGDGTKDTGYQMCHKFPGIGTYIVTLAARNLIGCDVIKKDTIRVTGPNAKIRIPPPVYCSEIRQYFDSSFMVQPNNGQTINQWSWDFGDGTAKSPVKNPVHVFPGGGDYKIRLRVKTTLGCEDSTTAIFHVIGPEVFGKIISDSVGCNPLKVDFTNLSKQSRTYIWQFGDVSNTVYSTKRDTNVSFTYKNAGTFYAKLVGGDSFYNPTTGSKYYCSVTYPPPGKEALKIVVFPTSLASFQIPDLFCIHDSVSVENTTTGDALTYHWDMGNGDTFTRKKDTFLYKYSTSGKYKIRMYGILNQSTLDACIDSAEKEIQVVILNPDFQQECNPQNGSELMLKNLSDVQLNGYQWTLFNPEDSTEQFLDSSYDLIHDFGKETGVKWICLGLKNDKVCGGKICKEVFIQGNVFIANVFTPGKDGFNDTYRIPMQGAKEFHLRIFNRWGELIFKSDDPKAEWNGTVFNTGPQLPTGTYFYQLQFKSVCEDKLYSLNGSINLIR